MIDFLGARLGEGRQVHLVQSSYGHDQATRPAIRGRYFSTFCSLTTYSSTLSLLCCFTHSLTHWTLFFFLYFCLIIPILITSSLPPAKETHTHGETGREKQSKILRGRWGEHPLRPTTTTTTITIIRAPGTSPRSLLATDNAAVQLLLPTTKRHWHLFAFLSLSPDQPSFRPQTLGTPVVFSTRRLAPRLRHLFTLAPRRTLNLGQKTLIISTSEPTSPV